MNKNRRYFQDDRLHTLLSTASIVVFDMNGLIIDDEPLQLESVNRALKAYGVTISEDLWMARCVGNRATDYFAWIRDEENIEAEYSVPKLVQEKNAFYHTLVSKRVRDIVRPGVMDLFDHVSRSSDQEPALGTSAHPAEIETVLGAGGLNLLHGFKYIVSGDQVAKGKPDPEVYTKISRISGIEPRYCLVIEDSGTGVAAAFNAGMRCIAFPNSYTARQDFGRADVVVSSLQKGAETLK